MKLKEAWENYRVSRWHPHCWRGAHRIKFGSNGMCINCGKQINPPSGQIKIPIYIPDKKETT